MVQIKKSVLNLLKNIRIICTTLFGTVWYRWYTVGKKAGVYGFSKTPETTTGQALEAFLA